MPRYTTANDIISRAAVEVGLGPITDAVSGTSEQSIQLKGLLDGAGQELVELYDWQQLNKEWLFNTIEGQSDYPLPEDFSRMNNQTGWDLTNQVPVGGPLTPQDWSYFVGRELISQNIYISFRLDSDFFKIYPSPPTPGLNLRFEYTSRYWVKPASGDNTETIQNGSDVILYDPILMIKFLKCKWLESKSMDASSARMEFDNLFEARTSGNKGAQKLNAGSVRRGINYINPWLNGPDTNYGHY